VAKTQTEKLTTLAVLVAEDEPTVRALAESIIADLGCSTFSAANAREALAVLENGTPITLLFTALSFACKLLSRRDQAPAPFRMTSTSLNPYP